MKELTRTMNDLIYTEVAVVYLNQYTQIILNMEFIGSSISLDSRRNHVSPERYVHYSALFSSSLDAYIELKSNIQRMNSEYTPLTEHTIRLNEELAAMDKKLVDLNYELTGILKQYKVMLNVLTEFKSDILLNTCLLLGVSGTTIDLENEPLVVLMVHSHRLS